jgi:hypothetical protein
MPELLSLPLGALDDDPGIRPQVGGAQSRCHFANTTPAAKALQAKTHTIPIVFVYVSDTLWPV